MNFDQNTLIMIAIVAMIIATIVKTLLDVYRRPKEPVTVVKTLLKCIECDYIQEVDYQQGDFIGLLKGKCPKCSSSLRVRGIYAIELKE
ncbi:MAG: hypothetical protein N3E36_04035 [Sulfolobales archaeon]|nr:hypothetical protein [Sulfolobales archaeon]MCX8199184.1 hypothetical protein [Sulfolobales archaeon]MDW8170164.1 hypothetical protein [Desulfurococcaceae archaeon]